MKRSVASTFERWWQIRGEWVEEANQRRGGESGVQRIAGKSGPLYCKRQSGHLHRSLCHPLGRPTVLREAESIRALRALGLGVPELVYYGARKQGDVWQAMLVTQELPGFVSLDRWYATQASAVSQATRMQVLDRLGQALALMHSAGWQHGCLYAKHIFVRIEEGTPGPVIELALIDLEKCRRRWLRHFAARHDMAQLARHRGNMSPADWEYLEAAHAAALAAYATN